MSSGSIQLAQGAVVCTDTKLNGNISIGPRSVVHPKVSIVADGGSIIIGEGNIIEEQSLIEHNVENGRPNTLMIGSHNVFEVGCTIKAKVIGNNNVFEAKCYVGPEIEVGNGCIIGAGVKLSYKEKLPDNVIITGSNYNRTIAGDKPPVRLNIQKNKLVQLNATNSSVGFFDQSTPELPPFEKIKRAKAECFMIKAS